jgi:hypothetical protein
VLIFKEDKGAVVVDVESLLETKLVVKSVSEPTPYLTNSAETIPPVISTVLTFKTEPVPLPFLILKSCPGLKFFPACKMEILEVVETIVASKIP